MNGSRILVAVALLASGLVMTSYDAMGGVVNGITFTGATGKLEGNLASNVDVGSVAGDDMTLYGRGNEDWALFSGTSITPSQQKSGGTALKNFATTNTLVNSAKIKFRWDDGDPTASSSGTTLGVKPSVTATTYDEFMTFDVDVESNRNYRLSAWLTDQRVRTRLRVWDDTASDWVNVSSETGNDKGDLRWHRVTIENIGSSTTINFRVGMEGWGGNSLTAFGAIALEKSYLISASAGPNGSVSPNDDVAVFSGSNQTFTISAAGGFAIADVLVDGGSVGATNSYTFSGVTNDHTIVASFVDASAPDISVLGIDGSVIADGSPTPGAANGTDFGAVLVGQVVTNTFAVTNNGTGNLILDGTPTVAINGDGDFSVISISTTNIAPGNAADLKIEFAPEVHGTRTGLVSIASNDGDTDPYTFAINGGLHLPTTLYWDGSTTGGGNGNSESWDFTSVNWNRSADYAGAAYGWADGATADFRGTGGSVTLGTNVTAERVIMRTTGYTLASTADEVLTLGSSGLTLDNSVNQSPGLSATVSADMALSANCTIRCGRREMLTLSGDLDVGSASLLISTDRTGAWQTYSGGISGSGSIQVSGNAAYLDGDNSGFSGTWEVLTTDYAKLSLRHANALGNASSVTLNGRAGPSLTVSTDVTFGGTLNLVQGGSYAPGVSVDADEVFSVSGKVTGDSLVLAGSGATLLSNAANDFTGDLTVASGTLGGTYGSTGGGNLTLTNATLAPGLSIGTFSHTGDVAFQPDSTLAIEVNATTSDTLAITGDLSISNSATTLAITELASPTGAVYTIATYTGVRSGQFAAVTGMPTGYAIDYDDANNRIILEGQPDLLMVGTNGDTIVNGDTSPDSDDGTDFGLVMVGDSITRTFTVTNAGMADLTLSGLSAFAVSGDTNDFSVSNLSSTSIAPGATATVDIEFTPTVYGGRTGTVSVTSNDLVGSPYQFAIGGGLALPVTLYWDGQTSGGANGVSDNWNLTATNWNAASDYTGAVYGWVDGATADFRGGGGTVTLQTNVMAERVYIRTVGYTVGTSGQTITLGSSGLRVDDGVSGEFAGTVGADIALSADCSFYVGKRDQVTLTGDLDVGTHSLLLDHQPQNSKSHTYVTGAVSGSGTITVEDFTASLMGDNSGFTGNWVVPGINKSRFKVQHANGLGNAASLSLTDNSETETLLIQANATFAGAITNMDTPTIRVGDGYTFTASGVMSGNGLVKEGLGTLYLANAANSFTGTLTVANGTLGGLAGSSGGALTMQPDTALTPGLSIGTFAQTGDVTFDTNSTLVIEVGGVSSDQLQIDGGLVISNTATVLEFSEVAGLGLTSYTIITNSGTRSGEFADTNSLPSGYAVVYEANRVLLKATGADLMLSAPSEANVKPTSATGQVYLNSPSGAASDALVTLYWIDGADPGQTFTGWDGTNVLVNAQSTGSMVEADMTNLLNNTAYAYRFFATNSLVGTSVWSVADTFFTRSLDTTVRGTDGQVVANGDREPSVVRGTDFGSLRFGSGMDTHTFTVTNSGSGTLELSGAPTVSPTDVGFSVLNLSSLSIPAGGTATFDVRFSPSVEGAFSAVVNLLSNDTTDSPYAFAVQGRGDPVAGSFSNTMEIAFSGYDRAETLTNFPVLLKLDPAAISKFRYSFLASPTGGDLRFSDSTGTQWLNYEVETWNTGGESLVWVQVPAFSSNTVILAHLGNTVGSLTAPNYTTNGATWSEGYEAVWHMNEAAALDSTSHGRDATIVGDGVSTASGRIGTGLSLNGTDDYLQIGSYPGVLGTSARTVLAWVKKTDSKDDCIASWGTASSGRQWTYLLDNVTGDSRPRVVVGSGHRRAQGHFADGTWHMVAVTLPGGAPNVTDATHYGDGIELALDSESARSVSTLAGGDVRVGDDFSDGSRDYAGLMDELRISSVERSSNWVWAAYMNVSDHESFVTYTADWDLGTLFRFQ